MEVQMELHRMIQLHHQEAVELQRGKNLQLLQPQHPVLQGQPMCGSSGGGTALLLGHPGTFSFPLAAVSSALGAAFTHAAGMHDGAAQQAADATAAGQDASPAAQQDAAAVAPAAADAAAQPPVSLSTPLVATPALTALQTPGSDGGATAARAADAGLPLPPALSPAVLGGGISSQQMALACNSMMRLPLQQVKQEAPALTPLQFQLPLLGMDTATPMLQQQQQPMHTHHTPLMQQLCSGAGPAPLSLFQGGPCLLQPEPRGTGSGDAAAGAASRKGKRQGYQIEHAALQRLIQRQSAVDGQQQQAAADSAHDLQQQQQQRLLPQQQHRQRSLARIPPQLQQQHLQQKQQQAQQQAKHQATQQQQPAAPAAQQQQAQQQQAAAPGAGGAAAAAAGGGWASPASAAAPGGGSQLQLPAGLDSPDACIGLQLPASLGADLLQPVTLEDLDSSKVFGSAQKRLRLSLCDEPASLVPAALQLRGLGSPPPGSHPTPRAAGATAAGGALATPSKFFSGSPVPLAARQQAQHTPETPLLFGHGSGGGEAATPPWPRGQLESERSGCFPLRQQPAAEQPSGWVPITGALAGTTPASAAAAAGTAVLAGDGDALLVPVDTGAAAAAAAIAAAAVITGRPKDGAAGADAGAAAGLATPQVAEQQALAPAATGPL